MFNKIFNLFRRNKSKRPAQLDPKKLTAFTSTEDAHIQPKKVRSGWMVKLPPRPIKQRPQRHTEFPGLCTDTARRLARKERREGTPAPVAKGMAATVLAKRSRVKRMAGRQPNQRTRWAAKIESGRVVDSGRRSIEFIKRYGPLMKMLEKI